MSICTYSIDKPIFLGFEKQLVVLVIFKTSWLVHMGSIGLTWIKYVCITEHAA
jgi:hypothetical protein